MIPFKIYLETKGKLIGLGIVIQPDKKSREKWWVVYRGETIGSIQGSKSRDAYTLRLQGQVETRPMRASDIRPYLYEYINS